MYAYMAYKFDITSGFTVRPGLKKNIESLSPVIARVGRRI